MNLEPVSPEQIAQSFGLRTFDGHTSRRGLAECLRALSMRQGMVLRSRLLRHGREQIAAAGLNDAFPQGSAGDLLDELIAQGDFQRVSVGHQTYILPGMPRWLDIGGGQAALLGIAASPKPLKSSDDGQSRTADLVRRYDLGSEESYAALRLGGFVGISWEEWLQPLGYVIHMARRADGPIRSDQQTLVSFWNFLVDLIAREGQPLSPEADFRFLTGNRGGFFGQWNSLECEGRWSMSADEGTWCAVRRGYGDSHWHPTVVTIDKGDRRALDLFDMDEWCWALLGRGEAESQPEIVRRVGDSIAVTFALPQQMRAAMDLLGRQTKPWHWTIAPDAPDIWALVR